MCDFENYTILLCVILEIKHNYFMSDLQTQHIMFLCGNSEIAQNLFMCDFENEA
jgi:hypothetical protein